MLQCWKISISILDVIRLEPNNFARVINEFYQRINYLEEPEFDSCMEQFLARFYLPLG